MPNTIDFANQRSAAISLAGILAFFSSGTNESGVQNKSGTESRPAQHVLALSVVQHRQVDLLENVLIRSAFKTIFAPTGNVAALAGKIFLVVGKADGADVGVPAEVDVAVEPDHGDVVVQVARVELVVDEYVGGVELDVSVEF